MKFTRVFFLCFAGLLIAPLANAAPSLLTHQGRLVGSDNQPLNGTVTLTFAMYNQSDGGSPLWQQVLSIAADDGYYTVALDVDSTLEGALEEDALYLGVTIDGYDEMSPRAPIGAVPYALRAKIAEKGVTPVDPDDVVTKEYVDLALATLTPGDHEHDVYVTQTEFESHQHEGQTGSGIQVGEDNSSCTSEKAGTMRWHDNTVQVCNGTDWKGLDWESPGDGSTAADAGDSCESIYNHGLGSIDGIYWIDPNGGNRNDAFEVFCIMESEGGGWTRIVKADTQGEIWSADAVNSVSETGDYKLSDTQINNLLALNDDEFNVRLKCGSYVGVIKTNPDFVWVSNGRTSGTCSSMYDGGGCTPYIGHQYYYGVQASTSDDGIMVSILAPSYGSSYTPCRMHNVGDFALDYWVR